MAAPCRRCSQCSIDWPHLVAYETCPACEGKTSVMSNGTPMDADEAKRQRAWYGFERFYDAGEYERWPDGDPRWPERVRYETVTLAEATALESIPTLEETA